MSDQKTWHVEGMSGRWEVLAPEEVGVSVTMYSGDVGRNRITSPSLNAPHSPQEALLAVLGLAESRVREYGESRVHLASERGVDYYSNATPLQARWLDEACVSVQGLLDMLTRQMRIAAERAGVVAIPEPEPEVSHG